MTIKRGSYKRGVLQDMYELFAELNTIPHETRKHWGRFGAWTSYDFMLTEVNAEISRLDRNRDRANTSNSRSEKALLEEDPLEGEN